ncbi:MAG TPA: immunity 53 family protein, partial [Myxococcus sp.]|nr:immunity 53 family protein [Myxococcus sp.]
MDALKRLQDWYARQCDEEWEHTYGVTIDTLDNPGWRVKINLKGTALESTPLDTVDVNHGDADWWMCRREGTDFFGVGDPTKLQTILEHFLAWAERAGS